jgi:hypothetical protein
MDEAAKARADYEIKAARLAKDVNEFKRLYV